MDMLALAGLGLDELGGGASDPAPDDIGELVVAVAMFLRLAAGDVGSILAVPPDQQHGRFPDLPFARHHPIEMKAGAARGFQTAPALPPLLWRHPASWRRWRAPSATVRCGRAPGPPCA